ncbi:tRNA pseudouridine(55) synthase TruB [Pseudomonas neustonica]|uniref:tRNA pseudouridine synthase B n=1 Tax=Pseudomonas neustonica TaxID=2487346 RepID=A0ABX9XJP8_9PSED|nr:MULTISPECIES: tRNA pseudouridine(55) synthase TruB [Pseudomonas]MBA6420114.1 tRNA pseudouridine(55) synthase TruB [Pseudomonas sp. 5Ae-yellow]ROZ81797.1 tRNA pseudouridine(55) synthase TruB [Pseudomonas sp. SSM44]ROZ83640.1 tRNA pseudouridine(55) synthase TruB [Pseudomonas neustonica]
MAGVKIKRRSIDGILIFDKPLGMSSNQALQKVRWLFNANKGGHTGSLDPLASGVLPLCLGEATKFSQYLLDADKAYITEARLGMTTTTGDAEGDVLEMKPVNISLADVEANLAQFTGDIEQIPPMYSALKHEGQPLYKLARAGETVERKPRAVTISVLKILGLEGDRLQLEVHCSKGTYIRTLVEDLGAALGCGAHVASLRRTVAGPFDLSQSVTLEALEALHAEGGAESLDHLLLPMDSGLQDWPILELTEQTAYYLNHGQAVRVPGSPAFGKVRLRDASGRFLGIGEMTEDARVAPKRLLRFNA